MHPARTLYRLAHSPRDLSACHRLARDHGMDAKTFTFPTVVADREGEIVGFLATQPSKTAVVAGPLAVATPRPLITVLRLLEAYENVLKAAGVSHYYFEVDAANHDWLRMIEQSSEQVNSIQPVQSTPEGTWHRRRLA